MKTGIRIAIDASTANINAKDGQLLNKCAASISRGTKRPRIQAHEYGWIIFLGDNVEAEVQAVKQFGFGPAMIALLRYAHQHHAFLISIDRDADLIDGLSLFFW